MSNCPHCGYSDPGAWQECPACGQFAGPAAAGPAPPPYAAAPPPHAATPPPHAAAPGDNPYAAPTAPSAPPTAYGYAYTPPSMLPTSGKAIASMVIGICSIVLYFLGFILGPLAIGLWASARNDFKQMPPLYKGQGLATAGLVTGLIGTLIGLLMVVFIILAIVMASQNPRHY
jgi:Domain of unknown function (DUF4190)